MGRQNRTNVWDGKIERMFGLAIRKFSTCSNMLGYDLFEQVFENLGNQRCEMVKCFDRTNVWGRLIERMFGHGSGKLSEYCYNIINYLNCLTIFPKKIFR